MSSRTRRVLLGQLAAAGDCVYATTIARQIKHDDPGCHLTWAIGSMYRAVIDGNPHVDAVWEVPLNSRSEMATAWRSFEAEARRRQRAGEYDDAYFTQIYPDHFHNFDGTVRASIFRGYPRPVTVPVVPVIRLSDREIERADAFARRARLAERGRVLLFECGPLSGQSFLTVDFALEVARKLRALEEDTAVILSSAQPVSGEGIIDGSALTFRENAAITRYCAGFVGCSSGITWLCTSEAATPLPMIQVLSRATGTYGAVVHDLEYFGLPSDHVIELRDPAADHVAHCIAALLSAGVASTRARFHEQVPLDFKHYFSVMFPFLRRGDVRTFVESLGHTIGRYGLRRELAAALGAELATRLSTAIARRPRMYS